MTLEIGVADPSDPISAVIHHIVRAHDGLAAFWSAADGWAPVEAAAVLDDCRLDRQAQLARCLYLWIDPPTASESDGRLILAWANLGALVEGAMQLGLAVFHVDYSQSSRAPRSRRKDLIVAPDLTIEPLRVFFRDEFWLPHESAHWDPWVHSVQRRRNAVHALRQRDIGSHDDFLAAVREYLTFLTAINQRLPYPR